jgi:hypothetical protein
MLRNAVFVSVLILVSVGAGSPLWAVSIPIANASFEAPAVDPNAFPAVPVVEQWTEIDLDAQGSTNTGVFGNTPADSDDHIVNADANQLAFLGSEQGNALEQDLQAAYKVGCDYRLTVDVGVSSKFPPSTQEPIDAVELILYYLEDANTVDIVSRTVDATGLSATELQDFSVYLPTVGSNEAWAGKTIGVAIRAAGLPGGFWDLDHVRLVESVPVFIPIANASFEAPAVDPNAFPAVPVVEQWIEIDLDTLGSTNTGVFGNTAPGGDDHIVNVDGSLLAFLGSEKGNALEQNLEATYRMGCDYRLTVAVGISSTFPPSAQEPADTLELVFYYVDDANAVDIASRTVEVTGLSATQLRDFSLTLPTVGSTDAWAGKTIGVAIRAAGLPGGFWDLDHVRLVESMPVTIPVANASFETPVVDPNGFPVLPYVDAWTELDVDLLGSTNTGVFANMPEGAWDRMGNADGEQLAFLGSEQGNGFEQDLQGVFEVGCSYRLTVAVGVSGRFPPSAEEPMDTVELVLYYWDDDEFVDIVRGVVVAPELPSRQLHDVSAYLAPVQWDDAWAGKSIGVAIRSAGLPGGFWDLDNVRLARSVPVEDDAPATEEQAP